MIECERCGNYWEPEEIITEDGIDLCHNCWQSKQREDEQRNF
jgi:formylmethanofuran dehydrogenase subunit E